MSNTDLSFWDRVTVVFVVHNSEPVIRDTLDNIKDAKHIIIIDNNSTDNTAAVAESHHPYVKVIRRSDNLGLTIASNQGFKLATTDYVLHINPDTTFDNNCIRQLVEDADANLNAAVVAPVVYNHLNEIELDVMHGHELRHHRLKELPQGPFCTWFVTGALCLWRKSALDTLNGFDENIFLYYEDSDICLRAAKAGYSLIIEPRVSGHHYGGQSGGKISIKSRWRRDWNMAWGYMYFMAKHGDYAATKKLAKQNLIRHALSVIKGICQFRLKRIVGQSARFAGTYRFLCKRGAWQRKHQLLQLD